METHPTETSRVVGVIGQTVYVVRKTNATGRDITRAPGSSLTHKKHTEEFMRKPMD